METINLLSPIKGDTATKTFIWKNDKWEKESDYPEKMFWFNGYEIEIKDLSEAYKILTDAQNNPCFMISGAFKKDVDLDKPIIRRKRDDHEDGRKPTIEDRETQLICFDVDGYDSGGIKPAPLQVMNFIKKEMPSEFQTADYIYQMSASFGLTTEKLKCHLFFWLKNPIHNLQLKKWIDFYNQLKGWGKTLDPKIYTSNQPIYIQKRICKGAEDPVKNFLGFVKREGALDFHFGRSTKFTYGMKEFIPETREFKVNQYDMTESIKKILTSESYHDELRSTALSLINKKVPSDTVKDLLKGAMNAAKGNSDAQRWKDRFNDIGRAVDSAVKIVDSPTIESALEWVKKTEESVIKIEFAKIALKLNPLDLKLFVDEVETKLGSGIANINKIIKAAKLEEKRKLEKEKRRKKSEIRAKKGVIEVEVNLSNSEAVCAKVCSILACSEKGARVFKVPGGLAYVGKGNPKTIRQVSKAHELGKDYPEIPIIQHYKKPLYALGARIENDVVFLNSKEKEIVCPTNILNMVGEATDKSFKPLTGIIEHPFVNQDFEIVQENGYNCQTGLFTVLHHKLKINLIDSKKAYGYLANIVLDEFPFQSDLDRCVAVSALLSCIQRPIIAGDSGMPGFGIVSPTQSSGKTTLAQLISYAIYNRPVAATNFSHEDDELSKHLLAILREGHSMVLFDNIPQSSDVKSDVLAKAMSSDTFGGRQLGENQTIEVPTAVIWLFTGNGINFVGDFATRIYPININPKMENPDTRNFKREDIGQWAMDNRKKIISAVLSIILDCKEPIKMKGSSRFKAWDRFVRQPLFKVSGIDINDSILENKKSDSVLRAKQHLLKLIFKEFETTKFKTKDLLNKAFTSFDSNQASTDLGETIEELFGEKKSTRAIGRYLSGLVGVVLGNFVLKKEKTNYSLWSVEQINKDENEK
jgi:hypothetical protein